MINYIKKLIPLRIKIYLKQRIRMLFPQLACHEGTADYWDKNSTADSDSYWWNFSIIRQYVQSRITGNPEQSWYTKVIKNRSNPFGRVLCFGDGWGMASEACHTRWDTQEIVFFNLSRGEGDRFMEEMAGIPASVDRQFVQGDANSFDFVSLGVFDTIINVGAFHHFANIKGILYQLNQILRSSGRIYIDEFIGPTRWRYEKKIIDLVNSELMNLPENLVGHRRMVKASNFENMIRCGTDISEAICSGRLDTAIRNEFSVLEAIPFGGSLMAPLFLTAQMEPRRLRIKEWHSSPEGEEALKRLVTLEWDLIQSGLLPPHYMYYVCKKRNR